MKRLKDCPYCGSTDVELKHKHGGDQTHSHDWFVECNTCLARSRKVADWDGAGSEAIKFWNARHNE